MSTHAASPNYHELTSTRPRTSQQRSATCERVAAEDTHPDMIQRQFKKLLTPGKIGQVLCLGNITSAPAYAFLRSLAPAFQAVKGDFDTETFPPVAQPAPGQGQDSFARPVPPPVGAAAPLTRIVQHGDLKMGMIHGHTVVPAGDADCLLSVARQMDVDVLLWAGTHRFEAYEMEGKFFINPGSATGALGTGWWTDGEEPTPSFVLMDVSAA